MSSSDGAFPAAAATIGRRIAADAVWHEGRCSWMGAIADRAQPWRAEYRALGPSIYDGTAGVGLFLAQLAATDVADVGPTAAGALRHAVARAHALPPHGRDGFHAGSLGIAWAAARGGALLGDEELIAGARTLPVVGLPSPGPDRCPDVVLGGAGAVIALLALAAELDEPRWLQEAVAGGEALIAGATVTRHGWSWASPGHRRPRHLCGLSHGAAGIGWALLELFGETGDERFRSAAMGAFAYERSWLDASSGTWPDLRIPGQRRGTRRPDPSPASGTWCHGEGGIALTRLRAMAVLGPEEHGSSAEVALEATRRHLAAALPYEIDDLTLCHGAAGAADVLLCAEDVLGGRWREAAGLARELGAVALERHGGGRDGWPCGMGGATTPGLFRGLGGIGWWLLRLADPAIPSPLTLPLSRLTPRRRGA
jgi:lantibiotic biosynthesis protein